MTSKASKLAVYAILYVLTAAVLIPFVGLLLAAMHPSDALVKGFSIPTEINLGNFAAAWTRGKFSLYMKSSVIVSTAVTVTAVFLSVLAGYAFGVLRFRGRNVLFWVLVAGMVIPGETLVVPLFQEFRTASILNTYWALILPQIGAVLPFGVLWMRSFFASAPRELIDASRVDGANSWTTLWRILTPLGRPAITSLAVLVAMWSWNNFILPLVMVTDESLRTAPLGLAFFSSMRATDLPLLATASVIVALPIVVLYVILQRDFVRGMMGGID